MRKGILFLAATLGVSVVGSPIQFSETSAVDNDMQTAIAASINGNAIVSGRLRSSDRFESGEYVQIDGVAKRGSDCSPKGLVGRDDDSVLLSCQFGVWQRAGGNINTVIRYNSTIDLDWSISTVSCAANETVTGGGGSCLRENGVAWFRRSFPHGNGWLADCYAWDDVMVTTEVWAICAY
ncbi:hypothetical protein BC936DRAFT_142211 [Jimgerdemannia flammicorona]|uniref:Bacterial shufflon protein N-terminal domain-containing protein n=1 Tax=Jimgerdemannia flammicorona TaxID=994334 RepID=A0A433DNF0_9FUNG|nr:hypothetical protein BC936DRAFT_142211 [Jimgerdemannia flammicorona]